VIVYAADTSYERRQRALAAGAELYITHDDGLMALQRAVIVLERDGRLRGPDRFALIGRIAAGAAHDLGNYLGVASLSLASLERRLDERMTGIERIQNELAMVRRALQAAERLASGILSYARGTTPEPEPVNLSTIVRKTLELFRRSVPTDVRIHSDLEAVPLIRGIDFELEQVVLNLILSAAEAMPEGGELGVFVGTNGNQVRLEITDSGRGLRAPLPKSTPRDNLGLGIAQTIAERHGAAMQIAPRATGGTRVLVDFVAI
jgi:signal transduction histidine kinase